MSYDNPRQDRGGYPAGQMATESSQEAERQMKGFRFKGLGWYFTDLDTLLVLPGIEPQPDDEGSEPTRYYFYIYNERNPCEAFNQIVNAPVRSDTRETNISLKVSSLDELRDVPSPEQKDSKDSGMRYALIVQKIKDGHWINVIKVCREITGLGLKEAKEFVDEIRGRSGKPGCLLAFGNP